MTSNPGNDCGKVWQPVATFYQFYDKKLPHCCHCCQTPATVRQRFLLCKNGLLPGLPLLPHLHLTSMRCSKNGVFGHNLLHLNKRYGSGGNSGNPGTGGNVKKLEAYRTNEKRLNNGGKTAAK